MIFSSNSDVRNVYGHKFTWTSNHKTEDEIRPLLYSYDKLANHALDRIDEISPPPSAKGWQCPHGSGPGQRDLYALIQEHAHEDEILGRFWSEVTTVPEWVDWDQLLRGQKVVRQFSGQIILGLLFKSLLGGMGAYRVVETLSRTGGFGVAVTRRRLLETFQHFLDVIVDLPSVQPGGQGFVSSVRVRLLHAAVRRRIMDLAAEKPGYYDTESWGVPINDLHCMGTVSVYSTSLIWLALPRQGVYLSQQQITDYLALWRWVGYLLGTPVHWMDTPAKAKAMMESVMVLEMAPSANSKILANNILTAESHVPPLYATREYLAAEAYRLNGDVLASALGIEKPRLYYRAIVWIQCIALLCLSYTWPLFSPAIQEKRHRRSMRIAYQMINDRKMGGPGEESTKFDFQYVPNLGQMTELGPLKTVVKAVQGESSLAVAVYFVVGAVAGVGLVAAHLMAQGARQQYDGELLI